MLPVNGNAALGVVYQVRLDVTEKTTVEITPTKPDAQTSRVLRPNSCVTTAVACRLLGNVTRKMIVVTVLTKAIFAPKKLAHISK